MARSQRGAKRLWIRRPAIRRCEEPRCQIARLNLSHPMRGAIAFLAQQRARFKRARADGEVAIAASVKFYILFLAKGADQLVKLGDGMFRLSTEKDIDQDDVEEAALDAGVEEAGERTGYRVVRYDIVSDVPALLGGLHRLKGAAA